MPKDIDIPSSLRRAHSPGYRTRRPGVDPGTRRLGLIAAGIGGVLIVVIGLWSMLGSKTSGVPVVPAPTTAMRVKPSNPGGMQIAGANAPILNNTPSSGKAQLAPPPETPDLSALRAPPSVSSKAAAPGPSGSEAAASAAPQSPTPRPPASATLAATTPPTPAVAPSGLPLPPPAPPPLRFAALTPAKPLPASIGTGKATEVQLAALSSKDAADREWQILRTALPALFATREPLITKVEVDGHTFWRLRTGGFANIADATEFCATVRVKGRACTIASF